MTEEKQLLTKDQVWDVLAFADKLARGFDIGGVYTPELLNQNLVNLTNNTNIPNYEKVIKALNAAPVSTDVLQSFSQYMEYFSSIYNKVATYKSNLLAFDLSYSCYNASGDDYKSKEYLEDKKRIHKFLNGFRYKELFKNVVRNLMRNGIYYTWFRDNGVAIDNTKIKAKYTLQVMPQSYCQLTGYSELGLLYDFDMSYFIQPGIDIDLFAPVFKDYRNNVLGEDYSHYKNYVPSNQFKYRDGTFALWTQTSPADGAWAFKYDTSNFAIVPPLATLMKDTVLDNEIQKLQYDKDIAGAYGLLMTDLKMLNSAEPNATALQPEFLGFLLNKVQSGLKRNIKVGVMPGERTSFYQFEDKNPDSYSDQLKTSSSMGASASRLIYSSDKMSQSEIENAILTDYADMSNLYSQFEQFLNYFANKKTRKYKFNFKFEGTPYRFEKESRQDRILELADRGIVLNESAFASAFGYEPQIFEAMVDEAKNGNFSDKLLQLISIHTSSNNKGGRPRKRSALSTPSRDYE
nr:MAG TPA: portal protein [Caudoviricetes sp.]